MSRMMVEVPDRLRAIAQALRSCGWREPSPSGPDEIIFLDDERKALVYLMHKGLDGTLRAIDRETAHQRSELHAWEDAARFFATRPHDNVMPLSAVRDGDAVKRIFDAYGYDQDDDGLPLKEVECELRATKKMLLHLREAREAVVFASPHPSCRAVGDGRGLVAGTRRSRSQDGTAGVPAA